MPGLPITALPGSGYVKNEDAGTWTRFTPIVENYPDAPANLLWERGHTVGDLATRQDVERVTSRAVVPAGGSAPQQEGQGIDIAAMLQQQHGPLLESINKQFDDAEAFVHSTIANDRTTLKEKYELQRRAIEGATGKDAIQKRAAIEALNLHFDEQMVDLRGKIRPDLEKLTGERQKAVAKANLDLFEAQSRVDQINELVRKGVLQPWQGLKEQLELTGLSMPEGYFKPQTPQTPVQRLRELTPVLRTYDQEALRYRVNPKTGQPQRLAPEDQWRGDVATDADWRDIPAGEMMGFLQFQQDHAALTEEAAALRRQIINRPVPDLAAAARQSRTPLAQMVAPQEATASLSSLSDEQLRQLAGM